MMCCTPGMDSFPAALAWLANARARPGGTSLTDRRSAIKVITLL